MITKFKAIEASECCECRDELPPGTWYLCYQSSQRAAKKNLCWKCTAVLTTELFELNRTGLEMVVMEVDEIKPRPKKSWRQRLGEYIMRSN